MRKISIYTVKNIFQTGIKWERSAYTGIASNKTSPCSLIRYPRFAKAAGTNSHKAFAGPDSCIFLQ